MNLATQLISEFAKATNDKAKKNQNGSTVYGELVVVNGVSYARIDGSELLTPVNTTTNGKDGDRVMITIKNHIATVTGNLTSPSATEEMLDEVNKEIAEFEHVVAYKVVTEDLQAVDAIIQNLKSVTARIENLDAVMVEIETLEVKYATLDYVTADDIEALTIDVENLRANIAQIANISTEDLKAINAELDNLVSYNANFTYVSASKLAAVHAAIDELDTKKLNAKDAKLQYATIDFANIGKAAMEYLYSASGLIKDVVVGNQTITGELVGVTIKGDLIEAGTLKADRLVILGSDGFYYKLNLNTLTDAELATMTSDKIEELKHGIHGKNIIAKTITADRISVTDLVAFGAKIGGFSISSGAIFSGVKETVNNTTRGIFFGSDGQMVVGDSDNYIKYYLDPTDNTYKLEIAAKSIKFVGSDNDISGIPDEEVDEMKADIESALETADSAKNAAEVNATRISETLFDIDAVKNIISSLITGQNGESLMTQTENGWTFSINNILENLSELHNGMTNTAEELNSMSAMVDALNNSVKDLGEYTEYIRFGVDDDDQPCIILGENDSDFKVKITNTAIQFIQGSDVPASISNKKLNVTDAVISGGLQQGSFEWRTRSNGNYGLVWKG